MATCNVTDDVCQDATPIGALTTRGQLGALAAGATVARCGSGSAIQRVMGRGHATSFVGLLWSDWVRPTIRRFVLQVSGTSLGLGGAAASYRTARLWFAASPLLLSASSGPCAPAAGALVDSRRAVDRVMCLDGGLSVSVRDVGTGASAAVMQCAPSVVHYLVANAGWAAMTMYSSVDVGRGCTSLAVASLRGLPGDTEEALGRGAAAAAVVVGIPSVSVVGPGLLRVYPDQSVDGEVVVVHIVENGAAIFVVDVEKTYGSGVLVVLSTTRCAFPSGHSLASLVVMRNWDRSSPGYGSRTFVVKTLRRAWNRGVHEVFHVEESTGTSRPLKCHDENVDDVFRLSDSVFCVSFCSNKQEGSFKLFHRDNAAQPLKLLPRTKFKFWNNAKKDNASIFHHVTAASGFIFKSFTNRIEVMEPVSGLIILTINFPRLTSLNLISPFSFF